MESSGQNFISIHVCEEANNFEIIIRFASITLYDLQILFFPMFTPK